MRSILDILIKHNHWFLFLLLEGISFVLVVFFNNYQRATIFTSANSIAGNVYSAITNVDSYFGLKSENEILVDHNKELINDIEILKARLREYEDSASIANMQFTSQHNEGFYYNTAKVVNNSINKVNNYITIDKGTSQGVNSQMGVFNDQGVIGVTYTSSSNYTVVMPLLNSKSIISCKVKDKGLCTLKWDGMETRYSYLIDLPRYELFENGDTVVTSGFSSIFPAGIPLGRIDRLEDSADGQSYRARVELFVDFSDIDNVFVVGNSNREEQEELEEIFN
ncbi:MAG: rod shape-determining protein MreC [Bacteroidaceae bacterium]|nr:rod shape-determining protein MreC [Bacteroidaceae bacterium]